MNLHRLRELRSHLTFLASQCLNARALGLGTPAVCYGTPSNVDRIAGECLKFQLDGLRIECVGTPSKAVACFADLQGGAALQAFFDLSDLEAALLFDCETYDEADWTNLGAVIARIELVLLGHPSAATTLNERAGDSFLQPISLR